MLICLTSSIFVNHNIYHFLCVYHNNKRGRWRMRKKYGVESNEQPVYSMNSLYVAYDYSQGKRGSSSSTAVTFTELELECSQQNVHDQSIN